MRSLRAVLVLFSSFTTALVACDTDVPLAAPDDWAPGAEALLAYLDYDGATRDHLVVEAGLRPAEAALIVAFRRGPDGAPDTADDREIFSVAQLTVAGLDGATLRRLMAYASEAGWDGDNPWVGRYDGVAFRLADANAALTVANSASFSTLDDEAGLFDGAAHAVIAARPLRHVEALSRVHGVGKSALEGLTAYGHALTRGPEAAGAGQL